MEHFKSKNNIIVQKKEKRSKIEDDKFSNFYLRYLVARILFHKKF